MEFIESLKCDTIKRAMAELVEWYPVCDMGCPCALQMRRFLTLQLGGGPMRRVWDILLDPPGDHWCHGKPLPPEDWQPFRERRVPHRHP